MFSSNQDKKQFTKLTQKQFNQIYTYLEIIGTGSYGQVIKAKNNHNKIVAIKKFKSFKLNYFMLILKQIQNLKKLQHKNILKFYQCYIVDQNKYYLVTQYCQNGKLDSYLQNNTLQLFDKLYISQQIAQGLAYAHSQNIVHRDLKPDNIFITNKNIVKIGDFGCSKSMEKVDQVLNSVVGSPAYMDDRVMSAEDYDLTVDIYSLGLVYYSIFNGKGIFDSCKTKKQIIQMKQKIYESYDVSMAQILGDIPQPINHIIKNCLQQNHKLRYTALHISQILKQHLIKQTHKAQQVRSTLDQLQPQIKDKQTLLAINLLSINKYNLYKLQCQQNQNIIYNLLNQYKINFNKISNIQKLKYVSTDTKAQYTFIVIFYYIYLLQQLDNLIHQKITTISNKHKIDALKITKKSLNLLQTYIKDQLQKIKPGLISVGKKIQKIIHLVDKKLYLPQKFKELVYNVVQYNKIDYNKYQDKVLRNDIQMFFQKRIKKQYQYNKEENQAVDKRLGIIQEIGKKFN